MKAYQQIPRNALVWIIIALFALVAPHAARIPIWVLAIYVLAALWRTMVYRGRWSFPGRWVKALMILSACGGIVLSYGTIVGLEPTVALLLAAFALKLIELSERKDAYVLLFLGYFICITEFLFSQDILITLYSFISVLFVTTALVALHQPGEHQFNRGSIRQAAVMLLQAMPLMVVLFFLFPRFGPLWSVPIKSGVARTGMSDNMSPGDVARLSQSADVAFRAKFAGEIPAQSDLYWRGLVFSRFESGVWSALGNFDIPVTEQRRANAISPPGTPIQYSVIMEPTQQNWLYGLRFARSRSPGIMHSHDYRLFQPTRLEAEIMYRAQSWVDATLELELSPWRIQTETALPYEGNERARRLARRLRSEAGDERAFMEAVLRRFNQEPYVYTLEPGALAPGNRIDAFLFETLRGFCEHYASAFVFLMRAADVPARVVAGYQGGEINPVNKTVIVHQFDAHAWAEVWLPGEGWVRVDPTAQVAPERIEWGLERALQAEGSFLSGAPLSPLRYRNIPLLNQLRLRYDALTYRWQSWVVNFNSEQQFDLLHDYLGELNARKFASVLLGSWALVLIPVAVFLFMRRNLNTLTPLDRYYRKFCDRLARVGLVRVPGESPLRFAHRVAGELPAHSEELVQITGMYEALAYARPTTRDSQADEELARFIRAVQRFRPAAGAKRKRHKRQSR